MLNNIFSPFEIRANPPVCAGFLEQTYYCTTIYALAISTSVREDNSYVRGRFIMRDVDDDHDHEDEDEDVASSLLSTRH